MPPADFDAADVDPLHLVNESPANCLICSRPGVCLYNCKPGVTLLAYPVGCDLCGNATVTPIGVIAGCELCGTLKAPANERSPSLAGTHETVRLNGAGASCLDASEERYAEYL